MPYTPQALADTVREVADDAAQRVGPDSIGALQYYREGEPQQFEVMELTDLITYAEEEALDLINYAVFLTLRLRRMKEIEHEIQTRMSQEHAQ